MLEHVGLFFIAGTFSGIMFRMYFTGNTAHGIFGLLLLITLASGIYYLGWWAVLTWFIAMVLGRQSALSALGD